MLRPCGQDWELQDPCFALGFGKPTAFAQDKTKRISRDYTFKHGNF